MKKNGIVLLIAFVSIVCTTFGTAVAQEMVMVDEMAVVNLTTVECMDHYYAPSNANNWFIQLGAGVQIPMVENQLDEGDAKLKATFAMGLGAGVWVSPYFAVRGTLLGGSIRWDNHNLSRAKYANLNMDVMWNMMNTCYGVNAKRFFNVNPFIGLGASYVWDTESEGSNIYNGDGIKTTTWAMPISVGFQLTFRLNNYVNLFAEARVQAYGDNFNGAAYGSPIDLNLSALGGISVNIGGATNFSKYNPCTALNHISMLNGEVNNLRKELAQSQQSLAVAQSAEKTCQVEKETIYETVVKKQILASVRFDINSSKISKMEMVNVYNVAEYLKANPEVAIVINGYADKDTGSKKYNRELSEKRAKAVCDALVKYGVDKKQLSVMSHGSKKQPYDINNWNRVVLFSTNCE